MNGWKEVQYDVLEYDESKKGYITRKFIREWKDHKLNDGIYECEKCNNHGYTLLVEEGGTPIFKKCSCYQIRRSRKRMKEMGLLNYLDENNSFDKFIAKADWQKRVKQKAIEFVDDYQNKMFYIGGQVGSGKTILCATIMGNILKDENLHDYEYMIWSDVLRTLTFDDKEKKEMNYYKNCEILFIDDFMRNPSRNNLQINSWEREIAMELINYRYLNKMTTIISSELYYQEIEQLDDAIASRIYENADNGNYILSIKREEQRNKRKQKVDLI